MLLIEMDERFRIAVCVKAMPCLFKILPQLQMVVDLPVEDNPDALIFAVDRLMAASHIDNGKASHPKSNAATDIGAAIIRAHDGRLRRSWSRSKMDQPGVLADRRPRQFHTWLGPSPTDNCFQRLVEPLLIDRPVVLSRYGIPPSSSHCGPDRFRLQCDDRSG